MRYCPVVGQLKRTRIARFERTAFMRAPCNSRSTARAFAASLICRVVLSTAGIAMAEISAKNCQHQHQFDECETAYFVRSVHKASARRPVTSVLRPLKSSQGHCQGWVSGHDVAA